MHTHNVQCTMNSVQLTRGWLPLTDQEEVSLFDFDFPKCKVYGVGVQCTVHTYNAH